MQLPTNHRHRKRSVTHSENIEWTMKQTETRVLSSSSLFVFSSGLKIIKNAAIEFLLVDLVYTDFLVRQDFVASRESIINVLN